MPPPPLLWMSPTRQEQRSLEMPKKALESPLKEQDLMVSMNQVLPATMVNMAASGNGKVPLRGSQKAELQKEELLKGKGDSGSKVQSQLPEFRQEVTSKRVDNASDLTVQVERSKCDQRGGPRSPELETLSAAPKKTSSPSPAASAPLSAASKKTSFPTPVPAPAKKTSLPVPADLGPLTAQPSTPPPAVVSQDLPQVLLTTSTSHKCFCL